MDRRQRKTREAIFNAFLSKKVFNNITVGEIIEKADVGRATFTLILKRRISLERAL